LFPPSALPVLAIDPDRFQLQRIAAAGILAYPNFQDPGKNTESARSH